MNRQANIDLYARVDKNKSRKGKDAWTDVNNETEVVQRSASVRCRGDRSQVPYIKKREITRIVSSLKERNDATLPPAPNEQVRKSNMSVYVFKKYLSKILPELVLCLSLKYKLVFYLL